MIETYKILSGKYDTNVVPHLKTTGIQATRGNPSIHPCLFAQSKVGLHVDNSMR